MYKRVAQPTETNMIHVPCTGPPNHLRLGDSIDMTISPLIHGLLVERIGP